MHVIVWEYSVKADRVTDFEKIYSADGDWAKFFRKSEGYLGTELLRDTTNPHRYVTIDRWTSLSDYEAFHSRWETEYAALDARCEGLTQQETLLGKWDLIPSET